MPWQPLSVPIPGKDTVSAPGVYPVAHSGDPLCVLLHRPETLRLTWRQYYKFDVLLNKAVYRFHVNSGLCEPHPFRITSEPLLEKVFGPSYLRELVPS